jgi:catechol 2,3-dioxygenase
MGHRLDLEVAHAVLHVCDAEAMIDFYTRVLDFEVTDRGPLGSGSGEEIIFLSQTADHHHQLAFITGRDGPGRSNNLNHVAFRSSGTLDDLRDLKHTLEAEPGVGHIRPLTHGNAWSVYFSDPEGNGVEVFIDTPWHVAQPQGKALDLERPTEEIEEWTEAAFRDEPEFGSLPEFYARRAEHLGGRRG